MSSPWARLGRKGQLLPHLSPSPPPLSPQISKLTDGAEVRQGHLLRHERRRDEQHMLWEEREPEGTQQGEAPVLVGRGVDGQAPLGGGGGACQ